MKKLLILLALSFLNLIGCGDIVSSKETHTVTVYGESPESFFSHFMRERRSCELAYRHRYLGRGGIELRETDKNEPVIASVKVVLETNHQFTVIYHSQSISLDKWGNSLRSDFEHKEVTGTWYINGHGRLVLPQVGIGEAIKVNDERQLLLKFDQTFVPRLNDIKEIGLEMFYFTDGPNDHCPPL
ncbi:hypothetical protein [Bdellovibrio sp. HCB2-146]|uniref:hypothetical protein n=1 Tax=Bdellovibrio sp. HCB2-146 TaxID=3394362 RepID=UPI0039BC70E8